MSVSCSRTVSHRWMTLTLSLDTGIRAGVLLIVWVDDGSRHQGIMVTRFLVRGIEASRRLAGVNGLV